MDTVKTTPVWAKSEFWVTAVTGLSGLLLAFGVITKGQADSLTTYVPNLIGAALALLSSLRYLDGQHAAKVEVFRAMCATHLERTHGEGSSVEAKAASSGACVAETERIVGFAKAVGL